MEPSPEAVVNSKRSSFKKFSFSRNQLIVFALVFAAIGGYVIYRSFASSLGTPYTITSSLADNSTITGSVIWTATVTPQPYEVDFYVDGVKDSHVEIYPPYQYKGDPNGVLNTTTLSNGKHTFEEVAIFDSGGATTLPAGYVQSGATITATHTLTVSNGAAAATPPVIAPPPTTPNASCTKVLAASDNLLNAYNAAHAGDVLCLPAGAVYSGDIDFRNSIGTASAPITITSQSRSNPAEILGRVVTHPGANYFTLSYLKLDGKSASGNPSPTVASDHFSLIHNDITDDNTSICINTINDSTYGTAHYTLIDHNRIHNCGPLPSTNRAHGIYDIGYYSTITNNYIYNNVDRGIQLREDHNATVKYNVSDSNGEGMIIGDTAGTGVNDEIAYNIFSNSNIRYNIEFYWASGPNGTQGNTIHDNCSWTASTGTYGQNSSVQPGFVGATIANTKFANPLYTNAGAKDYSLQSGSPCAGYGVQPGSTPGIN